ncbi:MAG: 3-deoxy-D-manno-octulosonic acid transferase [Gammaproteobacteria bacterium]|nr:3-deoxy-D-manno-octulosonic acid transferase [Gammaproteobacteria bacterium]
MNRFLYSTLFYLTTPLLILRLLWRSLRSPAYLKRWSERFALYSSDPASDKVDIAFHAVSVGEVHAAVPLINLLLDKQPSLRILVSTSTPTGSSRVTDLLLTDLSQHKVSHVYLPYDYPGATRRFLHKFDPDLLVIMETELWPNLLHACAAKGVKLLLANARLSEKSLNNYRKINRLAETMLNQLNRVTAQSLQDSERLQALGLPQSKVEVAGNMKYDMAINAAQFEQSQQDKKNFNGRPVLIAASTRAVDGVQEETKVLQAYQQLLNSCPNLLLVLVPRHPERFNTVYELASKQGFSIARRSNEGVADAGHQILLGDSMGEMHYYFGLADIAFVGGSLVPSGCQNIIEPAALGLPVITGPSLFNFQSVSDQLIQAGGLIKVANENEFAATVQDLLENSEARLAMGKAAQVSVQTNQGATTRNFQVINELLST